MEDNLLHNTGETFIFVYAKNKKGILCKLR